MEKLLTVSVAAYNGAATLQKALESCLVADESLQALLDVIIIDDGSTDGTAALAQAFVQAHPGSFRLVSKVNGGYGSTLNTAVELASGRYFRTLDCDDWFDTNALQTLLRRLQNCTADAVYTNYRTVQENGSGKAFDVCCKFDTNRVYAVGEVQQATPDLCMEMHALTLCTKTLRAAWRPMPEHCSYTDMGYTFVGMAAAQTICFVPVVLYQYRLGRGWPEREHGQLPRPHAGLHPRSAHSVGCCRTAGRTACPRRAGPAAGAAGAGCGAVPD
ncbi:MAG: glycosyltransferase family 2 protein [Subdoligranulum sp.]